MSALLVPVPELCDVPGQGEKQNPKERKDRAAGKWPGNSEVRCKKNSLLSLNTSYLGHALELSPLLSPCAQVSPGLTSTDLWLLSARVGTLCSAGLTGDRCWILCCARDNISLGPERAESVNW